jgi:hypothetical protein
VDNKQSEARERFLTGWRARMNHHEADDKQKEIREHHLGIGVALGSGLGVAVGAGLGVAFGNLALGIGICICLGVSLGIAIGSARGNKHAKAVQEASDTAGRRR